MPKKFVGENSKSAAARVRKDQNKQEERERVAKQKEDADWLDDDKNVQKKQQRKEDQERKRLETLAKKQEKKILLDAEMNAMPAKTTAASNKMTKAQIEAQKQKDEEARRCEEEGRKHEAQKIVQSEDFLTENINRLAVEGESARTVDEAISVLGNVSALAEKHPEKRVRAAYLAFEDRRMPELKADKPTFTLSQLRQLLKKEWQKSPENPLNENIMRIIK